MNATLQEWAANGMYMTYIAEQEFHGNAGQEKYVISPNAPADVIAQPYEQITEATATIGPNIYSLVFMTKKEWDAVPFKNFSAIGGWYSYDVQDTLTNFFVFPKSTGSEIYRIRGKQRIKVFDINEPLIGIPDSSLLALVYYVADELSVVENSTPSQRLAELKNYHYNMLRNKVKLDVEVEIVPPFRPYRSQNTWQGFGWYN